MATGSGCCYQPAIDLRETTMAAQVNVEPTAQAIDEMADVMEAKANELRALARGMRTNNDLTYAAEAAAVVKNTMGNLRIDLLVTRPLRELGVK